MAYASRFLNEHERRYSTNELELLAVVWGLEHFRNYIFGEQVKVLTDHKALVSVIEHSETAGKTFSSRLTRWMDRLAFYDSLIEHQPGESIGLAD